MLNFIKKIIGSSSVDFATLHQSGAIILDVRSKSEYSTGHIKGSINIPLQELATKLVKLRDKNTSIITCCASGMRSASAKNILKNAGYINVYNGGSWSSLQNKLKNYK